MIFFRFFYLIRKAIIDLLFKKLLNSFFLFILDQSSFIISLSDLPPVVIIVDDTVSKEARSSRKSENISSAPVARTPFCKQSIEYKLSATKSLFCQTKYFIFRMDIAFRIWSGNIFRVSIYDKSSDSNISKRKIIVCSSR